MGAVAGYYMKGHPLLLRQPVVADVDRGTADPEQEQDQVLILEDPVWL